MTQEELFEYRNKLISTLKANVCKITFKKTNGELREMICTNKIVYLPTTTKTQEELKKQKMKPRVENIYVVPTFDLNKKEFRSFRIENLLDIKILPEKEISQYVETTS